MPGDLTIDLAGAAKVLETAIGSVKSFAESLRDAVKAGYQTIDIVSARRAQKRLKNVLVEVNDLVIQQGIIFRPVTEKKVRVPDAPRWAKLREELKDLLKRVEELLAEVRAERSDVVTDDAHRMLLETLAGRQAALTRILEMEQPPTSDEEVAAFRSFVTHYVNLIVTMRQATTALAGYIAANEKGL